MTNHLGGGTVEQAMTIDESALGDLRQQPLRMEAQQGNQRVVIERLYHYDQTMVLKYSALQRDPIVPSWTQQRTLAYVHVDLKTKKAQAAAHWTEFQSSTFMKYQQQRQQRLRRLQPQPKRQDRPQFYRQRQSTPRILRAKIPAAWAKMQRMGRRLLRGVLQRREHPFPIQERRQWRRSWLGHITQGQTWDKSLKDLDLPQQALFGGTRLTQSQTYSRLSNLGILRLVDWCEDHKFQFRDVNPRRSLYPNVSPKPIPASSVKPKLVVNSVKVGYQSTKIKFQVPSGKQVTLSMTANTREAWQQVLPKPLRQEAQRWLKQRGQEVPSESGRTGHTGYRHGKRPTLQTALEKPTRTQSPLQVSWRCRDHQGETLQLRDKRGNNIYYCLSDTSAEALKAGLKTSLRSQRQNIPVSEVRRSPTAQVQRSPQPTVQRSQRQAQA